MEVSWVADAETLRSIFGLVGRDPLFDPVVFVRQGEKVVDELWRARSEMAIDRVDGVANLALCTRLENQVKQLRERNGRVYSPGWHVKPGKITGVGKAGELEVVSMQVEVEGSMVDVDSEDHPIMGSRVGPLCWQTLVMGRPYGTISQEWLTEVCKSCGRTRGEGELMRSCPFCGQRETGLGGWVAQEWRTDRQAGLEGDRRAERELFVGAEKRAGGVKVIEQERLKQVIPGFSERDFVAEARALFLAVTASRVEGKTNRLAGKVERVVEGAVVRESRDNLDAGWQLVEVVEVTGVRVVSLTESDGLRIGVSFGLEGSNYVRDRLTEQVVKGDASRKSWNEEWTFSWNGQRWLVASFGSEYEKKSIKSMLAERAARRPTTGGLSRRLSPASAPSETSQPV